MHFRRRARVGRDEVHRACYGLAVELSCDVDHVNVNDAVIQRVAIDDVDTRL